MDIRVYEISEEIHEEELKPLDKENISKVFSKIFSPENIDHNKIDCNANDDSILKEYHTGTETFDLMSFAEALKLAELKTDGTRNRQITEGYLFIKKENKKLFLLKLENLEVIDKDNNYEMRTSFTTESDYYKGCIFENSLRNIKVIDKNKSVAKYWREKFLSLELNRNDYQNSKYLIELIKKDKLFIQKIYESELFPKIKDVTESYLFSNTKFDKVILAEMLIGPGLIEEKNLNDIFSSESKLIDSEFDISKKAIKEEYHKTILISPETKISTENFTKLIKRQGIEYTDGKVILSIDEEFIDKLPEELKNGKD